MDGEGGMGGRVGMGDGGSMDGGVDLSGKVSMNRGGDISEVDMMAVGAYTGTEDENCGVGLRGLSR